MLIQLLSGNCLSMIILKKTIKSLLINNIKNKVNMSKAKPFIKWVGGKGQLIEQLEAQLADKEKVIF